MLLMIIFEMFYTCVTVMFMGFYVCYYLTKCKRPCIHASPSSQLALKLSECCSVLSEVFYPSFLFAQPDLQSLTTELSDLLIKTKLATRTSTIHLPDGGEISYTEPTEECGVDKKLIFIIVPGYTGDHKSPYILQLAETLADANVWPIIFTDRGKGGMSMKTAKFFSAGYNDGLAALLDIVLENNPNSNYGVIGISFGGMVACNTLHEYHRKEEIMVQLILSSPLDSLKTITRLNALRAKFFYSLPFGKKIKRLISNNQDVFKTKAQKKLFRSISRSESASLTDIDNVFIAPMFGYTNSTEYYKDICLSRCLKETKTFTICVNADDDPCYSKELFPVDLVKENPNVCLISTAAGGHFGFAGLGWPFHRVTFTDKLISQIVAMIHSQLK
ncbi:phospholipase ABHD3-like [Bolinopsis microptera]|uniref:phospholipase ABHD3-like n=1 Tax=Bolinopsis microptera TaxID=2820187 RepID=UPI00307A7E5C